MCFKTSAQNHLRVSPRISTPMDKRRITGPPPFGYMIWPLSLRHALDGMEERVDRNWCCAATTLNEALRRDGKQSSCLAQRPVRFSLTPLI